MVNYTSLSLWWLFTVITKKNYKSINKIFISCIKRHHFFHLCYIQCIRIFDECPLVEVIIDFWGKMPTQNLSWALQSIDDSFQYHSFHFEKIRADFLFLFLILVQILSYLFTYLVTWALRNYASLYPFIIFAVVYFLIIPLF